MPLLETEPTVIVRNLLADSWASNSITVTKSFETAWIGTGTWDEETPNEQITCTQVTMPTDPDGLASGGGGGLSSWVDGILDCDVWVPYRDKFDSSGLAKKHRWELTRKVHNIIENNQEGTTDANGNAQLTRLETGLIRFLTEDDDPVMFHAVIPVGYQFRTAP